MTFNNKQKKSELTCPSYNNTIYNIFNIALSWNRCHFIIRILTITTQNGTTNLREYTKVKAYEILQNLYHLYT